jgi:hypothetical protein
MTDPNINASPQSVADSLSGTDGGGNALSYREVDQLAEYAGPGVYFPAESPGQTTTSAFDLITTDAKVGLRLYKGLDWFDMIVALYQAAGEPAPKKP